MEVLSLIGIFVGLILMIILAYKGHSIIWVAPLCAFVVVLFALGTGLGEGRTLLSSYTVDYMEGVGNYFISWFPTFLLGAIYGKIMDVTGAAKALAEVIMKLIGARFVVLAVLVPCMLLTYGGVSLFVVVFIMYPIGDAIFRTANVPRTLLPGMIAFGSFGITMTAIPGSPQIQNLIPMEYFYTSATAAPWLGLAYSLVVSITGYLYLDSRVRKAKKLNQGYDGQSVELIAPTPMSEGGTTVPAAHWLSALFPLLVVFLTLNILKWHVVISLILGSIVCCIFNFRKLKQIPVALTEGSKSSVTAIMNTACAVGFGSVIRIVPGFALLAGLLIGQLTLPMGLFFSESLASGALSAATGSASGGLSIALNAFADQYLAVAGQLGVSPDLLHRFASIAAGAMDKLPHNGAVITLLTVTHCTHKESYKDILISSVLIPIGALVMMILIFGLIA